MELNVARLGRLVLLKYMKAPNKKRVTVACKEVWTFFHLA